MTPAEQQMLAMLEQNARNAQVVATEMANASAHAAQLSHAASESLRAYQLELAQAEQQARAADKKPVEEEKPPANPPGSGEAKGHVA